MAHLAGSVGQTELVLQAAGKCAVEVQWNRGWQLKLIPLSATLSGPLRKSIVLLKLSPGNTASDDNA